MSTVVPRAEPEDLATRSKDLAAEPSGAAGREVRIAPHLVLRLAGLPTAAAAALRCAQAAALAERYLAQEDRIAALGPRLQDAIYAVVPALDGEPRAVRRAALALGRDIHNRRRSEYDSSHLAVVQGRLAETDRAALSEWYTALSERASLEQRGAAALEAEAAAASACAMARLGEDEMDRALAVTSTSLRQTLVALPPRHPKPFSKVGRAMTRIVTRAALKTSPLSFYTRIGWTGFGAPAEEARIAAGAGASTVELPRALAMEVLRALCAGWAGSSPFPLEKAPIIDGEGQGQVLLASWNGALDFFWRADRLVAIEATPAAWQALPDRTHSPETWAALVRERGLDPALVGSWVASGLLRPVLPWPRREWRPLEALSRALEAMPGVAPVAEGLARLVDAETRFASASGDQRTSLDVQARREVKDIFAALEWPAPDWFDRGHLFVETVGMAGSVPAIPEPVRQDLAQAAEDLVRSATVEPIYPHLVAAFRREYPGGRCHDLPRFLSSIVEEVLRVASENADPSGEVSLDALRRGDDPEPCFPDEPLGLEIFAQLEAESLRAVAAGAYRLVIDRWTPSLGGGHCRYRRALADQADPAAAVAAWVKAACAPDPVLEIANNAEWNNLQHQALGLFPTLRLPSECRSLPDIDEVGPHRLSLVYDAGSNALRLLCDGAPVKLVYLGTVPTHLLSGAMRVLVTLAHPWRVPLPEIPGTVDASEVSGVSRADRIERGRVVLRRATWRVAVAEVPRRRQSADDFSYLCRMLRWRDEVGLPTEVFVALDSRRFRPRERKPLWLRFDSVHTLASVDDMLEGQDGLLRLTEALPTHDAHPLVDDGGGRRCAEVSALVACRPGRVR